MISRSKGNALVAHYEWIAAAVGVLALVGAVVYYLFGGSVEDRIAEVTGRISAGQKKATVAVLDLRDYSTITNVAKVKARVEGVTSKAAQYFASGKRYLCNNKDCGKVTPEKLDPDKNFVCVFCGATQEVKKVEVVLDADGDGMPDAWERKYGLNPLANDADEDKDGDEFTNLEEYQAKTDPTDRKDHPDPLDTLTITLPLKETYLPFLFMAANKIPSGWRCEFFDAKQKDDYGRLGRLFTAVVGEEIGKSGFVLKGYEKKSEKRSIKGSVNKKEVDVSEVSVERKGDGKKLKLVIAESKKAKPSSVDVQATLAYPRGATRSFDVVPGAEIVLSGAKYRISDIKAVGKGAKVTVENVVTGKKRDIEALEP